MFEDAPFPFRRQSEPDRRLARFGLHGFEDPFNADGPLSPFWSVAPMLDVEPARAGWPGFAGLAREAGTAFAGLRLAGAALVLKLERGGRAQEVRIGDGDAFDPVRDTLKVTLNVASDWPKRNARVGDP